MLYIHCSLTIDIINLSTLDILYFSPCDFMLIYTMTQFKEIYCIPIYLTTFLYKVQLFPFWSVLLRTHALRFQFNLALFFLKVCILQQNLSGDKLRKEKLGKFGPNIIQLLNEWADMFPYDFRDERMMKKLREITQRILAIYPELRPDVTNTTHSLVKKVCTYR